MQSVRKLPAIRPPPPCRHPGPARAGRASALGPALRWLAAGLWAAGGWAALGWAAGPVQAEPRALAAASITPESSLPEPWAAAVAQLASAAAATLWGDSAEPPRIEVQVGRPDARLRLAPCQQTQAYLPAASRPLGATRIGLRCTQGRSLWNISLPVTVKLWAPGLVASTALPAGTVLAAQHLVRAEVDLAERADPALLQAGAALGRSLARSLAAGQALRRDDLKTQQWFNTGDTVRILATGPGYAISGEGQAMGPGLDGQPARVRTEGGRVITGIATGERRVELTL